MQSKHKNNSYQILIHNNFEIKSTLTWLQNSTRIIFLTTTITNVDIFEIHKVDIFQAIGVCIW